MEILSKNMCFGGEQIVATHQSNVCNCDMTFAIFLPEAAQEHSVPVLWYLSGLTCTHENVMVKAGIQRVAAEYGIAVVFPDTSPRGDGVANDDSYDLGQGAGFYVNATQAPWSSHYQMWDYIASELPELVLSSFPVDNTRQGITGHSMGGHGALTLALTLPEQFKSVSAISPIANPTTSDWGQKQLGAYLGENTEDWLAHDASYLLATRGYHGPILVDQGEADDFLALLKPEALSAAAVEGGQDLKLRMHKGYDHSYFFVSTVIEDHMAHHAKQLNQRI